MTPLHELRTSMVRQSELPDYFGVSKDLVYDRCKGIREEIEKGRYSPYAIAEDGVTLVNIAVFFDYMVYHRRLSKPALRNNVPEFDVKACLKYLGIKTKIKKRKGVKL